MFDITRRNGSEMVHANIHSPGSTTPTASKSVAGTRSATFPIFPRLPAELRAKVWEAAITPGIVRYQRTNGQNVFTAPSKSHPLFETCRESREVAFLYGCYVLLSTSPSCVYFSPKVDYLLLDVGWKATAPQFLPPRNSPPPPFAPTGPPKAPQDVILLLEDIDPTLKMLRNVMVHPNVGYGDFNYFLFLACFRSPQLVSRNINFSRPSVIVVLLESNKEPLKLIFPLSVVERSANDADCSTCSISAVGKGPRGQR